MTIPQWKLHDIVILESDPKEPQKLMKVVGIQRDGLFKTQYIDKRQKRTVLIGPASDLRDPVLYGLSTERLSQAQLVLYQEEFQRVQRWNRDHPTPGAWITHQSDEGDPIRTNWTISLAYIKDRRAYVDLDNGGPCLLRFVNAAPGLDTE
jgi:hypothetical protein